jgi:hypothetical protein
LAGTPAATVGSAHKLESNAIDRQVRSYTPLRS